MLKKTKSKEKNKKPLSGRQVIAEIFGITPQYVSFIISGERPDKKGVLDELEQYQKYQQAYIKKRKIILSINQKQNTL